ncbi:hypothetical protein PG999_014181 [Apiospora kogelbergensis]|uniref:Cyclohexanone monooxygenase n=1 Tax=Apiospora kogelbergensis TaxID=1337665 RepID=A0AAW0Q6N8_9PEZI
MEHKEPDEHSPMRDSHCPTYEVHDVPLGTRRPIRVVCIGAGYSGLLMTIILSQKMKDQDVDYQVYEANGDLGGTWLVNRFPGCRCDTPAHIYAYSFNPNPNWSNVYATSSEIHKYMKDTSQKYDCDQFIKYHHRVTKAVWDEELHQWRLRVAQLATGCEIDDSCHVLINASGALNNWKWPQIDGIQSFKGTVMHSADWDESYDFENKEVAVIGIGSSGIQILPQLAKIAKRTTVYARSPTWITTQATTKPSTPPDGSPHFDDAKTIFNSNLDYLPELQERFASDPGYLQRYRVELANQRINSFKSIGGGRGSSEAMREAYSAIILAVLGDSAKAKDIAEHLVPSFPVGCRRITPDPGFLQALLRDDVDCVWEPIQHITKTGIQTAAGIADDSNSLQRDFDTIICATGFDYSYVQRFQLVGRDGVDLAHRWSDAAATANPPEAYFGTAVAGFPNYFTFVGPNSPVANGGLVQAIQAQGVYIYKCLTKMQSQGIRSMEVSEEAARDYNMHIQAYLRDSVWAADCSSWYKRGARQGPVVAVYAGSAHHFVENMRHPRWEDFRYVYGKMGHQGGALENRFAFLGNGFTKREAANGSVGTTQTLHFEDYWRLMELPPIYDS